MKLDVAVLAHGKIFAAYTNLPDEVARDLPPRIKEHVTEETDPFAENGGDKRRPRSRSGIFQKNTFFKGDEIPLSDEELLEEHNLRELEENAVWREAAAIAQEDFAASIARQKFEQKVAANSADQVADAEIARSEKSAEAADWEGHRPMSRETETEQTQEEEDVSALRPKPQPKPKLRPKPKPKRRAQKK